MYGRPLTFEGAKGKQKWTAFADEAAILNITNKGFQIGKVSDDVTRCSKVNAIMADGRNGT
jgi:hypothetical protein